MPSLLLQSDFVTIPAGEFLIGSRRNTDRQAGEDEMPQHTLNVSAFHIMRLPVTVAKYELFLQATNRKPPLGWSAAPGLVEKSDHPVVGTSLHDALAFASGPRRRSVCPVRLPSEPEFEKAARGPDGRIIPGATNRDRQPLPEPRSRSTQHRSCRCAFAGGR